MFRHTVPFVVLVAITISWCTTVARADWVNLTGAENAPNIAEIYVEDDHVRVVLEVFVADLSTFHRILPDELFSDGSSQRASQSQRLKAFSREDFQIITDQGRKLTARLDLVEPRLRKDRTLPFRYAKNPYTGQPLPGPPQDKRVAYVELVYPFEVRPGSLTFVPPRDSGGVVSATVGFILYHKSVPVTDYRFLSGPERLGLDWDDPWYSEFDNRNLGRHHRFALMSYLYVEPYEVRHEVLARVRDFESWVDLGLSGQTHIEVEQWDDVKSQMSAYLLTRNPVTIDGTTPDPILDRADFVTVGLTGIQLYDAPQRLDIATAIVGVILAYPTPGLPQGVTVDWELFTHRIQEVPATATDPAGPMLYKLTPEDSGYTWTNYLKKYELPTVAEVEVPAGVVDFGLPLLSLACLGLAWPSWKSLRKRKSRGQAFWMPVAMGLGLVVAAVLVYPLGQIRLAKPTLLARNLTPDEASQTVQGLLKNVYRAFDFRGEEVVYDKLAHSVSGDLLTEIYLQQRTSMEVKQAGGAQARVKQVEVQKVECTPHPDRDFAYQLDTRWTALGTVGHWGHTHVRQNQYHADLAVEAVDGHWKITGLDLIEETRIDPFAPDTTAPAP